MLLLNSHTELEKLDLVIEELLKISSEIEIPLERSSLYRMPVLVSVIFPHLLKGRLIHRKPSEDPFSALLDSSMKLSRTEYVR